MPASAASCAKGWALKGVLGGSFWPAAQERMLPAWQRCCCWSARAAPAPAALCGACGELWLGAGAQSSCHTAALGSSPACPRQCWQAARPIRQALSAHISFPSQTTSSRAGLSSPPHPQSPRLLHWGTAEPAPRCAHAAAAPQQGQGWALPTEEPPQTLLSTGKEQQVVSKRDKVPAVVSPLPTWVHPTHTEHRGYCP